MAGPSDKKTLQLGSPGLSPIEEPPAATNELSAAPIVESAWAAPPSPSDAPHGPKGTLVVQSPFASESPPAHHAPCGDTPDLWLDRAAESLLGPPQAQAQALSSELGPRRRKMVVAIGLGAFGTVALISIAALVCRPSRRGLATVAITSARLSDLSALLLAGPPVATTTPIAAPAGPVGPCTVSGEPMQLAAKASKDVPIEIRANADRSQVAVGFAADERTAAGVVIDLRTLEIKGRFRAPAMHIGRVVPVDGDKGFSFEVHAAGKGAHDDNSLTLATHPPRLVAWKNNEMSVTGEKGSAGASWTLNGKPSAVRAMTIDDKGGAIAFRVADTIQLAWLDQNGLPAGELSAVQSGGLRLGSPSLGWNGSQGLLAFAARESDQLPWAIHVARAAFGQAPSSNLIWAVPDGGPGGPVIAPSITNLEHNGWLMLWTEGKQGQREVRMQTCTEELQPVGEARTVSGQGNAGQGVGAVAAGKGIVAYLRGTRTHELWSAAIDCP